MIRKRHWSLLYNHPLLFGRKVVAKARYDALSLGTRLQFNPNKTVSFGPIEL